MTPTEFERLARKAIADLPTMFLPWLENVILVIEPHASDALLESLDVPDDEDIYGLYDGAALTDRNVNDPPAMPARIFLYYEPLLADCETDSELVHEIQTTVLHEIGHHFGMDEDQLEALGYG